MVDISYIDIIETIIFSSIFAFIIGFLVRAIKF